MKEKFASLYLDNQLCFPLYAASRLTIQIYTPFLNELELTYPQYLVMLVLWQHGQQTVSDIGHHLLLESNTLTPLLKRLEQKGLLLRSRSEADERIVIVSLTEKGEQLKEQAIHIPAAIMASFDDETITEAEAVAFKQTLGKLVNVLKKKTGV